MSTRQEILEYLENHPFASAEDLSLLLSKTRANIQYHLKQLEISGKVCMIYPHEAFTERGRPRRYYSMAASDRPNNMSQLTHALLMNLSLKMDDSESILSQIAKDIVSIPHNPSSGTARLNKLIKELNLRGYQSRWEAHAAGPEIVFRNCPYAALLPAHPELCRMDLKILETNLDMPLEQQTRIQLPGVPACRFAKKA